MVTVQRWTGAETKALRQAMRLSIRAFATYLGVDARTVNKWEARGASITLLPETQALMDTALSRTPDDVKTRFTQILDSAEPEGAESESVESALGQIVRRAVKVAFPVLEFDELRHLGAALDDARRYLDADVVGYFKRQMDSCIANDGTRGPAQTLPLVLGIVVAIERHARQTKTNVRRELLAFGAQAAEFVGWLYRDARQPRLAGHWRDRAMEWAQEAGDWPMQGYVLLKKSQAAWDERDGLRMLTLAQAAHDGPWQLPPLVQAEVAQQEARGLAMIGESSAAVDAKLNEAWEIFTGAEATAVELGCHYDRTLLTMQTAICYCEAGRPRQAVELYREHLDDEQISRRDRGYFLSLMASALAHAAEPEGAVAAGREALALAVDTHSLRTVHELKLVCSLLKPWRTHSAVRELCEAVLPLSGD